MTGGNHGSVGYNLIRGGCMRSLAISAIFFSVVGMSFGQSHQGPFWSLGGYGSILYPATGHAPATPPGGLNGPHFNFTSAQRTVANPVAASHPQHRRTA